MSSVCIVGLGYIGLPTAAMFASRGMQVFGVDTNKNVVEILRSGAIHIEERGLNELVATAVSSGRFQICDEPAKADSYVICVPTPIRQDKKVDLAAVRSAAESIVPHLKRGCLVVLESTSPPGTTTNVVQPILERSGLKAGPDFHLAYSPERVLPGRILEEIQGNDRVIGGVDEASSEAGRRLYSTFVKGTVLLTNAATAEMVKLMENTYRDVNIALANEFALLAERVGVDAWEAIGMANKHPRVSILNPGPGVGGHCIAVDPWFLVECAPDVTHVIRQSRVVNDSMPNHVCSLVTDLLKQVERPTVACLGVAYKANVDDTRESPAATIIRLLAAEDMTVRAHDPHVPTWEAPHVTFCATLSEAVDGTDAVVVLVDHTEYRRLQPEMLQGMRGRVVLDTRACIDSERLTQAGFTVKRLGGAR